MPCFIGCRPLSALCQSSDHACFRPRCARAWSEPRRRPRAKAGRPSRPGRRTWTDAETQMVPPAHTANSAHTAPWLDARLRGFLAYDNRGVRTARRTPCAHRPTGVRTVCAPPGAHRAGRKVFASRGLRRQVGRCAQTSQCAQGSPSHPPSGGSHILDRMHASKCCQPRPPAPQGASPRPSGPSSQARTTPPGLSPRPGGATPRGDDRERELP